MIRIKLSEATNAQLAKFAGEMGLEVKGQPNKAELLALCEQGGFDADTEIEVEPSPTQRRAMEQEASPAASDGDTVSESSLADLIVEVLIPKQEGAQEAVSVAVNGSALFIPRGKPAKIKYKYFAVLENAVGWSYAETEKGGLGDRDEVKRFPAQVLPGTDARVMAFLAQRGNG